MKQVLTCLLLLGSALGGYAQLWIGLDSTNKYGIISMTTYPDVGRMYLTGNFDTLGGVACNGIAYWDGTDFHALGGGVSNQAGGSLASLFPPLAVVLTDSDLVMAGAFDRLEGDYSLQYLAAYDGARWKPKGQPFDAPRYVSEINGQLFSIGFYLPSYVREPLSVWRNGDWEVFAPNFLTSWGGFRRGAYFKGEYYFAGQFQESEGKNYIARWDGRQWRSLEDGILGINAQVWDLQVYKGLLFVAGRFRWADGNVDDFLMAWTGNEWVDVIFPDVQYVAEVYDLAVIDDLLLYCWSALCGYR